MTGATRQPLVCAAVTFVATLAATSAAGTALAGLVAGVAAGIVAGAVVFLTGAERTPAAVEDTRLQDAVAANSQLRHDLRGALSPALLVSDRLTGHADPGVVKAGNVVVRAVERATALLEVNKQEDAARVGSPLPDLAAKVSPPAR